MLKGFEGIQQAFHDGELSDWFVAGWLVKKIALEGSQEDFDALPPFWRADLIAKLAEVEADDEGWMTIGNNCEDLMPYVAIVKTKVCFD
ncbi:hypothetical protein F2P45_33785 [Massilia sp. CCM 8733]|uniref:Uncharacterized protein n=1 Tax=Massilia mucilaginosa TaxID=2609282 RepID=A0ABX0P598_9BURK|nr:hypothetical protein [Massilia mucilaginosa]NHZ93930.1 hypothetical protein [Massilia mucilaginosa]